jgi:hypothetical protein
MMPGTAGWFRVTQYIVQPQRLSSGRISNRSVMYSRWSSANPSTASRALVDAHLRSQGHFQRLITDPNQVGLIRIERELRGREDGFLD